MNRQKSKAVVMKCVRIKSQIHNGERHLKSSNQTRTVVSHQISKSSVNNPTFIEQLRKSLDILEQSIKAVDTFNRCHVELSRRMELH